VAIHVEVLAREALQGVADGFDVVAAALGAGTISAMWRGGFDGWGERGMIFGRPCDVCGIERPITEGGDQGVA
jgi:hypothetical protein